MSETLEDIFPLVIIHKAIKVTGAALPNTNDADEYFAVWAECYNQNEIGTAYVPPSYLTVLDRSGNRVDDAVEKPVKLAAMEYRVAEIQAEYGITGEVTDIELISKILDRVWSGEWMGQFNFSHCIYLSELCSLLNLEMIDIWPVVEHLLTERRAVFQGNSHILEKPSKRGLS